MDNLEYDIDWAEIVDIFAREYGWTIEYIKSLDLGQITKLLRTIKKRYEKSSGQSTSSEELEKDNELSISDFKAMGGKERTREDGKKEIII
jgi:hypothetical protein